jgi:trk system potassium uptake protein TrkH
VLIFASIQCGCAGSTTGGIKVDRILIAFKAVSNEVKHRLHPSAVSQTHLSGQHLADGAVSAVLMYIVVYLIVVFLSVIAVMLCGCEATEAVSGVIASVGSVGPGLGELGCMDNYSAQPVMAKFIYAFDMFLGRVEIYPVLVAISLIFRRNR